MISTSQDWKDWSAEYGTFHIKAELDNGTKLNLTDEDFMLGSVSITDSVSGMGAFNVGGVITNSFNATLNNFGGKFNSYNLAGATIDVKFGIVWEEGSDTNLFDGASVVPNRKMANDGTTSAQTNAFYTGYIAVENGKEYTTNFLYGYMCLFDADKQYLGYATVTAYKFTASVDGEVVAYAVGNGLVPNLSSYYCKKVAVDEWIDRGVYTLEKPTSLGSTIKITGYDFMDRLNKKYDGTYDTRTNLFDPSDITQNKLLNTNGTLTDTTSTFVTGYIPAQPNTLYKISNILYGYVVCYDADKVRLGASAVLQTGQVTTLPYTAYIRGTGLSALLPQTSVKGEPNLLDTSTVWSNVYISRDGTISNLNERYVTDYIEVDDCVTYSANLLAGYVCCYDSSKNYIGYVDASSWSGTRWQFTTYIEGETVAYIRTYGYEPTISDDYVREYFGAFIFPYSASQMVENLCDTYGVGFDANSWGLDSFNVDEFEYNESTTCRQVVSWIMQIGGGYARINPQGVIECKKFNKHEWTSGDDLDGGVVDPWDELDSADGGTVDPWSSVTDYDGGSSGGAEFTLSKIKSMNVYIEDITITGVRAYVYNTVNDFEFETSGSEGYVIGLVDNPMITQSNVSSVADRVGNALNGLSFRPFDASIFGDPSIEAGDVIALQDYLGEVHVSLITSLTYSINASEQLECNAETTTSNFNSYASTSTSVVQDAYAYITKSLTDFVIAEGEADGWAFRVWNSGIKECWYRASVTSAAFNAWGNGYATAEYTVPDYPISFTSYPVVQMTAQVASGAGWALPNYSNYSVNNCGSYYVASLSSGSKNFTINIYAIGK